MYVTLLVLHVGDKDKTVSRLFRVCNDQITIEDLIYDIKTTTDVAYGKPHYVRAVHKGNTIQKGLTKQLCDYADEGNENMATITLIAEPYIELSPFIYNKLQE